MAQLQERMSLTSCPDLENLHHDQSLPINCAAERSNTNSSLTFNISGAKMGINTSLLIIDEIKLLKAEMLSGVTSLSGEEWQAKCSVLESKQMQLSDVMAKLSHGSLQKAIFKRRKKRKDVSVRRGKKQDGAIARQQLHTKIDEWLEEMQLSVEKVKTEESLKRQADLVLADVSKKQLDARRQLTLMTKLMKLRQLRIEAAVSRGEKVSTEQVVLFKSVTDKLTAFWDEQLKGYYLEEKGLRVMLEEESQDERRDEKEERKLGKCRSTLAEWHKLMFGTNNKPTQAQTDLQTFLTIRNDWDKFITPVDAPMASAIPVGWVLPARPSSDQWGKLVEKETEVLHV